MTKPWLQVGLYFKDSHGIFNQLDDTNTGFKFRKGYFAESRQVEIIGKLHCEPFNQDRCLLDNVSLEVTLKKSDGNFLHMCVDNKNVRLVLDEV